MWYNGTIKTMLMQGNDARNIYLHRIQHLFRDSLGFVNSYLNSFPVSFIIKCEVASKEGIFMKLNKLCALLLLILTVVVFAGCSTDKTESDPGDMDNAVNAGDNQIIAFRPVDCGIQSQKSYEYPFLGLNFVLPDEILSKIDSREVFVYTQEDYTLDYSISYGVLRFSATTKEQREQEGMSVDILSWEESLEKIGAIGVYRKEAVTQLNELTSCDTHNKIGESTDGTYEYYISTNSSGKADLVAELNKTEITIEAMHTLNAELGYSAFSSDRLEGINEIGRFSTVDVFGNGYSEEVFQEYDLTLVNVFATWCSPCVEEIPELEKLRQEYADKGIKLGVIAVVLDTKTVSGTDENAVKLAQKLFEKSGANFPFLVPDDGNMGGRLTGIESVPESFFVDSNGNIVSEPYIGANTLEQWRQIVDTEFGNLKENTK